MADLDFQFDQTTAANFTASGDASVDANFTQTSTAIKVASGVAQVDFNFTQTSAAIAILYLLSDQTAQFDYDPLGGLLLRTGLSMDSQFDITEALGGFLRFAAQTMDSEFIMTADGAILWVQVDASGTPESWTQVTHTGDSWTEINAGTSSETWTNKVV